MLHALDALQRLREGNARFASDVRSLESMISHTRREQITVKQEPLAIVLGCSDARAPAETVFDQGLGDLFIIRVAGNIVAPSQVGSVEFAASKFGTQLVVVMGHTGCGAVTATLDELRQPVRNQSPNLKSIVDRVRPAVEPLLGTNLKDDPERLLREAIRANVRASANHLRHGSEILENLIARGELLVVGAEYEISTGKVEFFDGVPDRAGEADTGLSVKSAARP